MSRLPWAALVPLLVLAGMLALIVTDPGGTVCR